MISAPVEYDLSVAKREYAILLVDDSSLVRKRLKEMLAEVCGNCQILEAEAPDSAMDTLKAREIDVVVMDIRMPRGSGMDAIAEVKKARPGARVIMLTNYSDSYY